MNFIDWTPHHLSGLFLFISQLHVQTLSHSRAGVTHWVCQLSGVPTGPRKCQREREWERAGQSRAGDSSVMERSLWTCVCVSKIKILSLLEDQHLLLMQLLPLNQLVLHFLVFTEMCRVRFDPAIFVAAFCLFRVEKVSVVSQCCTVFPLHNVAYSYT